MTTQALNQLADKVVISKATGNSDLYRDAVCELLKAVRALATVSDVQPDGDVLAIAQDAIDLMTEFHSHAEPDETPEMNACFPAAEFRKFVDAHARLMYRMAQYRKAPLEPAYLRLRTTADEVCAVLGAHGEISARDDRVAALLDALYGCDDGSPEKAKPVYTATTMAQLDDLGAEVARLQKALAFWLPSVTDREDEVACRILEDAFLLVGCGSDEQSAQELGWIQFASTQPAQPISSEAPDRIELQAKGKHPAPCARHCEANAFNIEIRQLKAQLAASASPAPDVRPSVPVSDEQIHAAACDLYDALTADASFEMRCVDGTTNIVGVIKEAWKHCSTQPASVQGVSEPHEGLMVVRMGPKPLCCNEGVDGSCCGNGACAWKREKEEASKSWDMLASQPAVAVPQEPTPCLICGETEPYTGTCGSRDPRALCKQAAAPAVQVPDASKEALLAAVSALYFADNSDYESALYSVVRHLAPDMLNELETNPQKVFERAQVLVTAAPPAPSAPSVSDAYADLVDAVERIISASCFKNEEEFNDFKRSIADARTIVSATPASQAAPSVPEGWRESLSLTVERLNDDAEMYDRSGHNSTAEDRRARAHEISKMIAAAPAPSVPDGWQLVPKDHNYAPNVFDKMVLAVRRAMTNPGFNEPGDIEAAGEWNGNTTNLVRTIIAAATKHQELFPDGFPSRAAAPAPSVSADATLHRIADVFCIGSEARTPDTILTNVENAMRRSQCLRAVEREFFMVPTEVDDDFPDEEPGEECMLNWGSDPAEYVEQFRAAIAAKAKEPKGAGE